MMPTPREEIAGLRADIARHREQTRRIRDGIRALKRLPFRQRDPMGVLRAHQALSERLRMISAAQARIDELRVTA